MLTTLGPATVLRCYTPRGCSTSAVSHILMKRIGGFTAWYAAGAWRGPDNQEVVEEVRVTEAVLMYVDGHALAREIGEAFMAANPDEKEFLAVLTGGTNQSVRITRN